MVGRELGGMFPPRTRRTSEPMLACDRLGDGTEFAEVSFTVGAGEIVGIAGLVGSGREEVVDALYGLRRLTAGTVTLAGKPIRIDTPATALAHGFALVPRDRRHAGLVLDMTVADNVNLASLDRWPSLGIERRGMALRRAAELVARLDIRPPDTGQGREIPQRRQPAEGRAGALARHRRPAVHPRRADHRRRYRRQGRDLSPGRRAGGPRC